MALRKRRVAMPRLMPPFAYGLTLAAAVLAPSPRVAAQSAPAQSAPAPSAPAWSMVPRGYRVRDLAERRFDAASGLHATTAFDLELDEHGVPWLAADDGLYQYVDGQWRRDALLDEFAFQQIRSLVITADGTKWLGTRRGILRRPASGATQVFREPQGVPGRVAYSLIETRAIDGTPRIVTGASNGIAYFNGRAFIPLRMPALASPWVGVMVAEGTDARGAPVLWAANSAGGVARYAGGTWTTFGEAEGLTSPAAQFVLPVSDGPLRGVYVATTDGVQVLAGDGATGRFTRLPDSPRDVYRLAVTKGPSGADELWVGTLDGSLWRWARGRWERIPSSISERRGAVSLLRAFPGHGGGLSVYVSSRNGYLVRIAYGGGATVDLPTPRTGPIVTALTVQANRTSPDRLWVATQDDGLLQIAPDGATIRHPFGAATPRGFVSFLARVPVSPPAAGAATDTAVVALAKGVPWRSRGTAFEAFSAGLADTPLIEVRRVRLPNGQSALVGTSDRGLRQWSGRQWEPVPGLDGHPVQTVLDGTEGGAPVLYLGGAHEVLTFGRAGLRVDSLPSSPAVSTGQGVVTRLCRIRSGDTSRLFVLDSERGVYWREEAAGAPWRLFPTTPLVPLANLGVLNLRCLPNATVAIASFSGLSIFDVSAPDARAWRLRAQVSDADGLPSITVGDIESGSGGTLWVGSPYGLGVVDVLRAAATPPARLLLHLMVGNSGSAIREGGVVPATFDDIHVDPQLLTFHREESTRFRVRIVRRDPWHFGGGDHEIGATDGLFVDAASRMYHDLAPGQYTVQVWGYDWAGREYGPKTQQFSIETPLALRWYAILSYVLALGALLAGLYRVRVSTLQRASADLLESERRALDSERRFRLLFEQALDAHLLLDQGRVQAANAEAARLFGQDSAAALLGRDLPQLLGAVPAVCASGEHEIRRGDLLVPVQCTVTDVPTNTGALQHVVMRDLTDVRKSEAERAWFESQVREAQKLESLGTLAGGVAHDFNNLLGVIRGNAELARGAQRKGRSTEEYVGAILDASDRARDIVKQILTFSRRSTPTRGYVNLSSLIVDLQPLLRRMIPRTVSLAVEGTDTPQLLMGDPTQLQQLILNLVSNAEYAMRSRTDGQLVLAVSSAMVPEGQAAPVGDVVVLRVRDNGDGMSEDVRSRIFEPFFTTKPTGEGTGLGMAVVHGIVMSHDGHAEVFSAPGEGSTFEMRFPRAQIEGLFDDDLFDSDEAAAEAMASGVTENLMLGTPPAGTPVPGIDVEPAIRFAGTTIVVVDDEPTVARVVERALEQFGHVVRVFLTPEPALHYIREHLHGVDLLITDQTMPGMTGDQLTESVKALRPDLPVLILTGYSHRLTAERVAAVHARAVLLKPVELDVLKRAVDDALAAGSRS